MARQLKIGDIAPNFALLNAANETVHLQDLWAIRPTLLSFIRHFGCLFCREWLSQLEQHKDVLSDAGIQVLVVAMGQPKHITRYCGRLAPSIDCVVHETTQPYDAYGLIQGSWKEFVSFDVLKAGVHAYFKGHTTGQMIGDPRMMPGSFIVDQQGKIAYSYYSEHVADHPDIATLVRVVQGKH